MNWLYRDVPEGLRPAKGIINGVILGAICWIVIIAIVMLCFCQADAFMRDDWSKTDTAKEIAWEALHAIDWKQTNYISRHPERFRELNPVIGKHPSVGRVNLYMASWAVVHPVISYILPKKYRSYWQWGTIFITTGCVINNKMIGIKVRF